MGLVRSGTIPRPFIDLVPGSMQQCCHLGAAVREIGIGVIEEMI